MKVMTRCTLLALATLPLLAGCDSVRQPLDQRTQQVVDMGRMALPNSPHKLHGYRLDNGAHPDHFVYILEDESGQVLAGTESNQLYRSGKSTRNSAISTKLQTAPTESGGVELDVKLRCASVQECQEKLRRLQDTAN